MDERQFRKWLDKNGGELLTEIGLRENQTLLDYGCGAGTCAIPAARIVGPSGRVYALDTSRRALVKVRKQARREGLENIEIIVPDGTLATGLQDASADVALLYDVMQKIDDWATLFGELHRVLRPEGMLSVFPMHVGKDKLLAAMDEPRLFELTGELRGNVLNFRRLTKAAGAGQSP